MVTGRFSASRLGTVRPTKVGMSTAHGPSQGVFEGVDLVVSDCHSGLVRAIQEQFQGASWQRCQTHLTRNILSAVPKHLQPEIHSRLRSIFTASDLETARILLNATLDSYEDQVPKAMETLENEFDDAVAVFTLPERYRRKLALRHGGKA